MYVTLLRKLIILTITTQDQTLNPVKMYYNRFYAYQHVPLM